MTTFATVADNCPQVAVLVDFTNPPTNPTRVWTNITPYVRQLSYQSTNRQDQLQTSQAGTLSMLLDNRDARFDPTNTASPYSPGVKRMRYIRVVGKWSGVEYNRWTGLVNAWNQNWPEAGHDATCAVSATDAFLPANLFDLGGQSFGRELSGAYVSDVLTAVGLPFQAGTGKTTITASGTISVGTKALDMLQSVTDTENGTLFADSGGSIIFQDRHYRLLTPSSATAVAIIGDSAGGGVYGAGLYGAGVYSGAAEIPYSDGELDYDDTELWPTVAITPTGGTAEMWSDSTAQTDYFDRVLSKSILSDSQTEALQSAQYLSGRYGNPAPRIPQLNLLVRNTPTFWPTILSATISQRFTWTRRAAATISSDVFVEGITETVTPGTNWLTSLQLSPADTRPLWVLGVAGKSNLGNSSYLAY